jgi:acyl-CoA synthetase (AMP-forming)/AMP-acid ligase II/acyl carrier protein
VTWNALLHSGWHGKRNLKALCGGEALSPQLAQGLLRTCQEVWNMYGPTETTIWSALHNLKEGDTQVTIGRPIANTEILILDPQLNPTPIGVVGEIYIGGSGLARGYFNRPELTKEKFVSHPFKSNARLYRTGDLGYFLPDGNIICLGRTDSQVKVRGFRIELGEIEAALEEYPAVRKAVIHTREDGSGTKELVAYWISNSDRINENDLRKFLQERLPAHMIPTAWMQVDEFPLTPNGKIDRKRLPEVVSITPSTRHMAAQPATRFEREVADTWKSVLKLGEVAVTDDFFEVGGHSLAAMRVVGSLRSKYNVELTLANFFREPTIQALAAQVEKLVKEHLEQVAKNHPEQSMVSV